VLVDLIDRLRCPNDHADTWLVAAAGRTAHRHLVDATLGCPECGAEFAVRDGEVWFGPGAGRASLHVGEGDALPVSEDDVLRAAALLHLEERGLYLLDGGWGSLASALQQMIDVDLLLADPPRAAALGEGQGQGTLRGIGDRWPLAAASLRGIAVDQATSVRLADAVRVLRAGGRLVAPAGAPLPAGVRELARDARHWVAEKVGDVVPLMRRAK